MADELRDRWHSIDFPTLAEIARRLEEGEGFAGPQQVHETLPAVPLSEIFKAFVNLESSGYVVARILRGDNQVLSAHATSLTERGRRATGLWPREDAAADALIELLDQAADQSRDDDDASALRKAGRLLRGVPSAVLADVTAALIRQQAGI